MNIKIFLLFLAIVIPTLGEFKEQFRKTSLRYFSILLIAAAAVMQFYSDKKGDKEHIAQYNETIKKGDSTIVKLDSAYLSIKVMQDTIRQQLGLQKSINDDSKQLLLKNKELTDNLKKVAGNVDNVAYPLFPMTITVCAELNIADAPSALKNYVFDLKRNYNGNKSFTVNHVFIARDGKTDTVKQIDMRAVVGILKDDILEQYRWQTRFQFAIINPSQNSLEKINANTAQMDFSIGDSEKDYKDIEANMFINFDNNKLYFITAYSEHSFQNANISDQLYITNTMINSKSLQGSYLISNAKPKILAVMLSANNGLQKPCSMIFDRHDTTKIGALKFQYHKIIKTDFYNLTKVQDYIVKLLPGY